MRTLKKTLCLVLCLAMMAGLCVFASADFKDQDKIENEEAVAVLTGIGVIQGDDKGNFNPEGTLTRAEATVIITKLLGAADIKATTDKFTDVTENYWGMPYIAYCVAEGIVAGMGDGTFAPNAKLTGYQWATLLLRTLGYKIEGESWQIDVAKLVKSLDLADGITFNGVNEISRQDAAQMAFNALTVAKVHYEGGTKITAGGVEIVTDSKLVVGEDGTLADNFDLKAPVYGIITENQGTGAEKTTVVAATVENGKITGFAGTGVAYSFESGLEDIGHIVKLYYKSAKTVYAVLDESEVVTVSKTISTAADLKAAFGKNTEEAGKTYLFTNYVGVSGNNNTDYNKSASTATVGTYVLFGGEVVAQVLPATNAKILQKVTAYTAPTAKKTGEVTITGVAANGTFNSTSAAITLKKLSDEETEDVIALYDGIKTGAYVYVTKIGDNTMTVEAAEVVTASATARNTTAKKVTLDGVSYGYVTTDYSAMGLDEVTDAVLGTTYNFVLNADGKVAGYYGYTTESKASEYALVLDVLYKDGEAPSLSNNYTTKYASVTAYVLLANGTKATYTYTSEETTDVSALKTEMGIQNEIKENSVIKYAVEENVFTEVNAYTETLTSAAIVAKTAKVDGGKYLTSSTPIIYQDTTDLSKAATLVKGYAAAEAADAGEALFVTDSKGVIVVVFVMKNYAGSDKVETNIAYIPAAISGSTDSFLENGKVRYNYTVYIDGEATTLVAANTSITSSSNSGFVTYTLTNDLLTGFSTTITGYQAAEGTVGYVDDDIIVINNTQYDLNDAVVITDDTKNDGDVTLGGTVAAEQTVKVLYNGNGVAYIAIVVAAAD